MAKSVIAHAAESFAHRAVVYGLRFDPLRASAFGPTLRDHAVSFLLGETRSADNKSADDCDKPRKVEDISEGGLIDFHEPIMRHFGTKRKTANRHQGRGKPSLAAGTHRTLP